MILELLLAHHCRDCTACGQNGRCKLQELAGRFHLRDVRFPNTAEGPRRDDSSPCISRDENKCILCGDCVRMCNEIQAVGAIDFAHRGARMKVSAVFDKPVADSPCVGCGQCAAVCPTAAITVKDDVPAVWEALEDRGVKVTVQIAPAVRVALGREFGLDGAGGAGPGNAAENALGRAAAALRRMGFDEIFDTATGADMTVLEESAELLKRLETARSFHGGNQETVPFGRCGTPLFTSCCPAWVRLCEKQYPEVLPLLSTARSPMQMFASVINEDVNRSSSRRHVHVAVMPCTAKKFEARRPEFVYGGNGGVTKQMVDYVITTQELIRMIRESGIVFSELSPEAVDMPFGTISGAGLIFGVTGGVAEAVLRRLISDKSPESLMALSFRGVRGMEGVKTASVTLGEREVRIGVVSGLGNAAKLVEKLKTGEEYFDFVEVMACPGGCVGGAGQPAATAAEQEARGRGLYSADRMTAVKRSEENPLMMSLYNGILKGRVHELLHVNYARAGGSVSDRHVSGVCRQEEVK
jgi:NADH-quinone oxidoreductase subunit G